MVLNVSCAFPLVVGHLCLCTFKFCVALRFALRSSSSMLSTFRVLAIHEAHQLDIHETPPPCERNRVGNDI